MRLWNRKCSRLAAILFVLAPAAVATVEIQVVSGVESVNPGPDGTLYLFGAGIIATTPGAYLATPTSDSQNFLMHYDPVAGRTLYTTYLNFAPSGISIDAAGAAYLIGQSFDPNFPITPGAFNRNLTGGEEFVVAKLNPAGTAMQFVTLLGGSGHAYGAPAIRGVAIGADGSVLVTGTTCAKNFPVTTGAFLTASANQYGCDAFFSELSPDASTLVYSTYLSASESSSGQSIAVGPDGKVHLAGTTGAADFPTTTGTFSTLAGNEYVLDRVFLAIWDPSAQQFDALSAFGSELNALSFAWSGSRVAIYVYDLGDPLQSTPGAIWPMQQGCVLVLDVSTWQLVYATGLPDETDLAALAIGADGSVTIAGSGTDAIPPSAGAYMLSAGPFVAQFDPTGAHIVLATYFPLEGGTDAFFKAAITPNWIYVSPDLSFYGQPVAVNWSPAIPAIPTPPAPGVNCATLNAFPSVVQQCGTVVPQQILRWDACNSLLPSAQVRSGSPTGPLVGSTTSGGLTIAPGNTTFYLLDPSGNVLATEQTVDQPAFRCNAVPTPQGQLTATPNPVLACAGNPPTGTETSLAGYSLSSQATEIDVNAPGGQEMAYSPTAYISAETGDWVADGTAFFLTPHGSATPLAMDRVYLLPILSCVSGAPPAPAAIQAIPNHIACSSGVPAVLAWNSAGIQPVEILQSSLTGPVAGRFDATSGLLEVNPTATTTYHLAGYVAGVWQDLGNDTVYCGGSPF
ncbi:MAG TPA: hypothetical protein VME43_18630 [Bryobacteraceae bacterium]|nr:hypothetical protein [Bryobacteraceae bacterium]